MIQLPCHILHFPLSILHFSPALPPSEFADTEVSTNFTFAVGEGSNRRLVFSLELSASPTNNVEVAIGCDADEDGSLSLDEAVLSENREISQHGGAELWYNALCLVGGTVAMIVHK